MRSKTKNRILFCVVSAIWVALDQASKAHFEYWYQVGELAGSPIAGLFQFRLVHNTGAAWGLFDDSTFILGALSSLICLILLVVAFAFSKRLSKGEILGLALVFAGGLGNVIDRFVLGYVRDFIEFTFIEFPVFNIADMGVTCGIVIFALCFFIREKNESTHELEKPYCEKSDSV